MKHLIPIFLSLLLLVGCDTAERTPALEPKSSSSSASELIPPPSSSKTEPEKSSTPESSSPSSESVPDPEPESTSQESSDGAAVDQVEAMLVYLKENLDPRDYTDVQRGGDGNRIDILTPFPEAAKSVVEAYTGVTVPVEYYHEEFSKGQLEQAKMDLKQFLEDHPEIKVWDWKPILLFGGYQINLKENNDKLAEFIGGYPVVGIYQTTVSPEKESMHPD